MATTRRVASMSDIRVGDRVRVTAGMHAGAVGVVAEVHPAAPNAYAVIDSAGERIAAFVGVLELVDEGPRDIPRERVEALLAKVRETESMTNETCVFPRGFDLRIAERDGQVIVCVDLHGSARSETMPLEPHEARTIAGLLRNATEHDGTDWQARAEYAEGELSAALGLPPGIGPAEGEAKRLFDAAIAERDRLRRELEALRSTVDDRMSDLEESGMTTDRSEWHDSRSGDAMAHAELDAVRDDLDAILRGEP
jgi:hypothetical protein